MPGLGDTDVGEDHGKLSLQIFPLASRNGVYFSTPRIRAGLVTLGGVMLYQFQTGASRGFS